MGLAYNRVSGGYVQHLIPSTTLGSWTDPNSVLQSVSVSGLSVALTLKNPAAGRDLPTTGASILIPLRNMLGTLTTDGDCMSMLQPVVTWTAATSVPAYTWFSVTPVVGASPTVSSNGVGHGADGDGTGTRPNIYYNTGAGWTVLFGASGYSATARGLTGRRLCNSDGSIATNQGSQLFDSNGLALNARNDNVNRNLGTAPIVHAYVMLSVGWTSALGTTGAVITIAPHIVAGRVVRLPGVS